MSFHWGLDLGETELVAVRLSVDDAGFEIVDFAIAPIPGRPGGRGPAEKAEALGELVRRLHLRRAVVHAATPECEAVLRDDSLRLEDLEGTPETVRRRLLDLLPGELAPYEVRYEMRARSEEAGYRLLSMPRDSVERSAALLAAADLHRAALHCGALAPVVALETMPPPTDRFAALRIGARVSVLTVHRAGGVTRYRIPFGEEDLASVVASSLGVDTPEAFVRLADGDDEAAAAQAELLDLLASDVARLVEYEKNRGVEMPVEALYPIGSAALRPAVVERLSARDDLPVQRLRPPPPEVLGRSGRAARDDFEESYPRILGALGAAHLGLGPRDQPLVLRPLPPAPEPVRIGLYAAASCLLLILLLAAWAVTREDVRRLESLEWRQARLAVELPRSARSPADLARDRERVDRRLDLLDRKLATRAALRAVDAVRPEPRPGQAFRLEKLTVRGPRVEARLHVRLPRGADAVEAGEATRRAVSDRIRSILGGGASVLLETFDGGYRLLASWEVGP